MDTQITELDPISSVYALLGLTEANGGIALVPAEDVEMAISLYPQNLKYAASNIAMMLANAAAIAADPQQFSLQGVMSVAFHDPSAHWRAVAKVLLQQADAEYNAGREPVNMVVTQFKSRYEIDEAADYSPNRHNPFRRYT